MKGNILVTGGTGYIGSHTAVELINAGYNVYILDNLSNSSIEVIDNIEKITNKKPEFHKIDVCKKKDLNDFFSKTPQIDAIIHFAAYKAVGESVEQPLKYYQNNLVSMINLLEAMQKFKISKLVFSSSCTVYGQPEKLPVTEKSPVLKAESPYGNTKQICEEIISDTLKSCKSINAIALRYFNPIGAHPSALIGELPLGVPNNLVPFITQTAAGLRNQLSVFGNNYNTPDGTAIRDYIYVCDLALAHLAALKYMENGENENNFEVFNVGTGKGNTVFEVITEFEKATDKKLNYKIADRRAGDIEKIWADTSFANKKLKWEAQYTLGYALKTAWEWEKNIRNLKQ